MTVERATRTLVVWCPDWPVVAAGFGPGDAVAVVEANIVVACSRAARDAGVAVGLRRREAQARCPEAVVVAADPSRDMRTFEPVVAVLEGAFVPAVEVLRPGICAFATRGPSRYFGGDDALAGRVTAAVASLGVDVRVGIADGALAARLAARRARVVPAGESAPFLAPFPVRVLGHPELADLLARLGVRTLGDLAALPAADVLARFGPAGAVAHRLARGLDERPLAPRQPPPELTVTAELDPPVERVDAAAFAGKALADELCTRLAERGLASARVRVEAETEHGETLARLWRHDGALTASAIADRVRWQLDGWLTARAACGCPPADGCPGGDACPSPSGGTSGALTLLRLVPDEVHADVGRPQAFWGAGAGDARAARALARVQGLLGPDAVTTAVLAGGRSPGERVSLVPWGDPREPARPPAPPWPGSPPPPSPATVHPDPLPAEVRDGDGQPVRVSGRGLASGDPARLAVGGGRWVEVSAWAGPWLVDERWWDAAARRRCARWQVVTADGAAHLLRLEGGRWLVEATYD